MTNTSYIHQPEKAFSFTRLPNFLFEAPTFRPLSNEAKVLYAFILRRTELSRKNGWADDCGRIFLYYPICEVVDLLHCGRQKAVNTLRELCALPGFVDSKNEEKTERNAGYLVVSQSGGGMLRQGTREGIRRTPANRGMRAHRIVKGLDISEDVCHGMCP